MSQLISVIIPVYNSQKTIIKSLESITNQLGSYNFEIIIINDGSTDASEDLINNFISENESLLIKYYHKKNGGVSSSRNIGLKNAQGDFIAFLDSDDAWEESKIKTQLTIFAENSEVDFLATNMDGVNLNRFFFLKIKRLQKISPKLLLYKNFFKTPTVIFKSEIIKKVGYFNEEMNYAEDLEYFLRIISGYNCFLYNKSLVNSITGKYSYGESGLSAALWKIQLGEQKSIKKGLELKFINIFEFIFISSFSFLKYIRRFFITKMR